jgi:hypothetical protein
MRKSKEASAADESPARPEAPAKVRNLSVEARIGHYRQQAAVEKAQCGELEVMTAGVVRRDKDGNAVIEGGVPVIETRQITKHAAIDMKYNVLIEKLERTGQL